MIASFVRKVVDIGDSKQIQVCQLDQRHCLREEKKKLDDLLMNLLQKQEYNLDEFAGCFFARSRIFLADDVDDTCDAAVADCTASCC